MRITRTIRISSFRIDSLMQAITRTAIPRPLHLYGSKMFIFLLDAVLRSSSSLMCIRAIPGLRNVAPDELQLRASNLLTVPGHQ